MEQQLSAGLGEGQIAQIVEDDEVHAGQVVRHAALLGAAGLGLKAVHQIDDVEEAGARAAPKERAGDGDAEVGLAGSGATAQKLFNRSTNGALSLPAGTYRFTCSLLWTSMSSTSGSAKFDLTGAGSAVFGKMSMQDFGSRGTVVVGGTTATFGTTPDVPASGGVLATAAIPAARRTIMRGRDRHRKDADRVDQVVGEEGMNQFGAALGDKVRSVLALQTFPRVDVGEDR